MNRICYVISAGECTGINIIKKEDDLVIAADGGYKYVVENGIVPDVVLGDFDSLGYVPEGVDVIKHKPEKDDTDTALAMQLGIDKGYREFVFWGALGGRLDHTVANISLLEYLSNRQMKGVIKAEDVEVTAITDGVAVLNSTGADVGKVFSVFSATDVSRGVYITGAKYEVSNVELKREISLGVSNEFVGSDVQIKVEKGTLIIMRYV